jgi:hypothetical protein
MPCEERDKLLDSFLAAAKAHSDAAHAMVGRHGTALERFAESARKTYEDYHDALEAHELSHGCASKAITASGK